MYLGREDHDPLFRLREAVMEQKTKETLASLSVTTVRSVRQPVATLSGGQRQSVAVARAVMWNSRVVILDEPTAALGVAQTRQVLDLVKRLAEKGQGVVIVSHNLHDIFEVADRITVLRLGRNVGVYERAQDDAAGDRRRDHRRRPDQGLRDPGHRRAGGRRMSAAADAPRPRPSRRRPRGRRAFARSPRERLDAIRAGDVGSLPVLIGIVAITIFFTLKSSFFFTAVNFTNLIGQMAGVTTIAIGVVFVLLIGEIDLSIAYLGALAAIVMAELQMPESGHDWPGWLAIAAGIAVGVGLGAFQGSFVAFVGVPSFVVTLAGLLAWQGVILQAARHARA